MWPFLLNIGHSVQYTFICIHTRSTIYDIFIPYNLLAKFHGRIAINLCFCIVVAWPFRFICTCTVNQWERENRLLFWHMYFVKNFLRSTHVSIVVQYMSTIVSHVASEAVKSQAFDLWSERNEEKYYFFERGRKGGGPISVSHHFYTRNTHVTSSTNYKRHTVGWLAWVQ